MTYFYVNKGCKCSSHVPYNGNWLKNSKAAKNNATSFLNSYTVSVNVKCTINCKHNTINGLGLFSSYHLRQNYRWYHLLLMNENLDRVIRSNKIRMTKSVWQTVFFSNSLNTASNAAAWAHSSCQEIPGSWYHHLNLFSLVFPKGRI